MALQISDNIYARITTHLQAAYPNEGAGILIGSGNGDGKTVQAIKSFVNKFEAGERYHRYLITGQDMEAGEIEADRLGLGVIGVFHSHPDHPAQPSEYDREHAPYALPTFSYLIVSIQHGKASDARSWLLTDDRTKFDEEKVEVKQSVIRNA